LYTAVGVSAGVLTCAFCCVIIIIVKWKARSRFSARDKNEMEPVYDTIDPVYEVKMITDNNNIMAGMTDNAAYLVINKLSA
jgi:hypothetical protein